MPGGPPEDGRFHAIVHLGRPVLGASCDSLLRDIAARLPPERRREVAALVDTWPLDAEGCPRDSDALFARLLALREGLARPPAETARRALRVIAAALLGFIGGGIVIGLGAGVSLLLFGALTGASQFEGAFAMGVAALMPLAGFWGGIGVAVWLAWRSWRRSGAGR